MTMRVVSLESRRREELSRLLERYGMRAIEAPSMREVPLEDQSEALSFGRVLLAAECDVLVLLTGVGLRALLDALCEQHPRETLIAALGRTLLACRGPKPVAVLKELGLKPNVLAPEPNTTAELVGALDRVDLAGKRVYVQEYGRENRELAVALEARGARVRSVPVYAWQLPEDVGPLERVVSVLIEGGTDAIVLTSAQQLVHLLQVAGSREPQVLEALRTRVLVASIGPVTSSALAERGVIADLEPEHPKMGHLIKTLAERGAALLARKRSS
jgi:uroporphyrinogen-III synthase